MIIDSKSEMKYEQQYFISIQKSNCSGETDMVTFNNEQITDIDFIL